MKVVHKSQYLYPIIVITDSQEDNLVLIIIVFSPVNIKSCVKECVVHQGSARHNLVVVCIICSPAVHAHKDQILGLSLLDPLFPFINLKKVCKIFLSKLF